MTTLFAVLLAVSSCWASDGIIPKNRAVRSGGSAHHTRAVGVAHVNGPSARAASAAGAGAATSAGIAYSGGPSEATHPVFSGGRMLQRAGTGMSPNATPRMLGGGAATTAQPAPSSFTGGAGPAAITGSRATPVGGAGVSAGKADSAPQNPSSMADNMMKGVLNGLSDMFGYMAELMGGSSAKK